MKAAVSLDDLMTFSPAPFSSELPGMQRGGDYVLLSDVRALLSSAPPRTDSAKPAREPPNCTCHTYDRPQECQKKFAASECIASAALPPLSVSALNAMLTQFGMDEDEWNCHTFNQARKALAAAPNSQVPDLPMLGPVAQGIYDTLTRAGKSSKDAYYMAVAATKIAGSTTDSQGAPSEMHVCPRHDFDLVADPKAGCAKCNAESQGAPKPVAFGSKDGYWVRAEDLEDRPDKDEFTEAFYASHSDGAQAAGLDARDAARYRYLRTRDVTLEAEDGPQYVSYTPSLGDDGSKLDFLVDEAMAAGQALQALLDHVDRETCRHETTHRGGAIWTICDDCGQKWADDRGGFKTYEDAPAVAKARAMAAGQDAEAMRMFWDDQSLEEKEHYRRAVKAAG